MASAPKIAVSPWLAAAVLACLVCAARLPGEAVEARAVAEKTQVYLGEPFLFQIRVEGADSADEPDLSALKHFSVEDLGGQRNSSQSVTIVNGQVNRVVTKGYTFSYRLTAKKSGVLTIPPVEVTAGGETVRTNSLKVRVGEPKESDDFHLRMTLSESDVYVGQPLTLRVTWYIGKDVEDFSMEMPVLSDRRFEVRSYDYDVDPQHSNRYVKVPLGGKHVVAKKGRNTLNGREFLMVRFRKILIPRRAGRFSLPQASVTCQAVSGYRRARSLLDDFFDDDFFAMGRNAVHETYIVKSNQPALRVRELPAEGRPANFSGLIGDYDIRAEASPTELSVGDPITLTLQVSGPRYLAPVELPPLSAQPELARDFKIPEDRAPGTVKNGEKIFTQTLRPKHAEASRIPPIELTYFNPQTGRYAKARTSAIRLKVEGTRIVTARDAEGADGGGPLQTELETLEGGIAHNYDDFGALENQVHGLEAWLASPGWLALAGLPPLVYLGLAGLQLFRRRSGEPALRRARRAHRELVRNLSRIEDGAAEDPESLGAVLDALRRYLGDRLGLPARALTFADVQQAVQGRNVEAETLAALGKVFERCEAGRYAGAGIAAGPAAREALDAAGRLERELK